MPDVVVEKQIRLHDPVVTAGDRVYAICSQNGLFPDTWGGHVPGEMWGVWDHPIKLLDGYSFGLRPLAGAPIRWLSEAHTCRVGPGWTEFAYSLGPWEIVRRDISPDGVEGLVVELRLAHTGGEATELPELIALFRSDLRPAWLGEQVGMIDGPDQATWEQQPAGVIFTDAANPWSVALGVDRPVSDVAIGRDLWATQETGGHGISARLVVPLSASDDGVSSARIFIAGSARSVGDAQSTLARLQEGYAELTATKEARYRAIAATSSVTTPEASITAALLWTKLNCQMLMRDVPPHGRGVGAGMPVYPWWFGIDTEYAVLPMLQAGLFEQVSETLQLLHRASLATNSDQPGRVIHELTTTGVVFNRGNLVETPAFTRAVYQYWLWTGDDALMRALYPFCKQGVLEHTLWSNDPDGDLCPAGRSVIETLEMHAGFECIDVASYTWEALLCLADLAAAVGDEAIVPGLLQRAETLGRRIREEWWLDDEGLFADVRATPQEVRTALQRIEHRTSAPDAHPDMRRQAREAHRLFAGALAEHGDAQEEDLHWLLRHWVVLCPVEVGLATQEQAARLVARMHSPEFSTAWGLCLHPDRRSVMSINTGMLGLAAARYGLNDTALEIVRRMADALPYHMPGAISEALPDQWCFIQLWSALGVISPSVECFLGVAPRAAARLLRVVPNLPATWERLEAGRLRVGDTYVDICAEVHSSGATLRVAGDATGYQLELGWSIPGDARVGEVLVNGVPCQWRWESTRAGNCIVCEASVPATLEVFFGERPASMTQHNTTRGRQ
jgi:glycogen debranching enzyme